MRKNVKNISREIFFKKYKVGVAMKLIIGLGNPGNEYKNTRHNIGFEIIDKFAEKHNLSINKKKYNGVYEETFIYNQKVILLKPQAYMNLSGEVVKKFIDFYKIDIKEILIINDDLDLEIGKFKLKQKGSSGGHNGLKNIEQNIGTKEYKRLKVGISNNKDIDTKDYVLGKFSKLEQDILELTQKQILDILDDFLILSFEELMSKYNHK